MTVVRRAMELDLTLSEALAADRLDDFVRQEVAMGAELVSGSELERNTPGTTVPLQKRMARG